MGPPGLDDVGELRGLRLQRRAEPVDRRQQIALDLAEGGDVDRRREDVVRGLAHVDVVVRVGPVAGERGDHLVRVHVRGGARPGLEDVDRELVIVLAGRDCVAAGGDPLSQVGVELAELGVDPRRGGLQPPELADDGHRDPLAGNRKVLYRLRGLTTPELLSQSRRLHRVHHIAAYSTAVARGP